MGVLYVEREDTAMTDHITCQDGPSRVGLPYTVILMLPDDLRGDESCESDWVRRMWVIASNSTKAQWYAKEELAYLLEWSLPRRRADLAVISVFLGHQVDLFVEATP